MIKKCNLEFRENDILTKEMLAQLNLQPQWLFLDDYPLHATGVISGFNFEMLDSQCVLTKGNILIDGIWFRMPEDFIFLTDKLVSGQMYQIFLQCLNGDYCVEIVEKNQNLNLCEEDIRVAVFKYEGGIAFRIPTSLEHFTDSKKEAYLHDMRLVYFNRNGIPALNPLLSKCVLKSIRTSKTKSLEKQMIMNEICNTGTVSMISLAYYMNLTDDNDMNLQPDDRLRALLKRINSDNIREEYQIKTSDDVGKKTIKKRRGW